MTQTGRSKSRTDFAFAATVTNESIIDKRAVVIGLLIAGLIGLGAVAWKLSSAPPPPPKKIEEFQFSVADPDPEAFKLKDPTRDIIQERMEEADPEEVLQEERPNIQVTTNPIITAVNTEEVIKSDNLAVDTPTIEIGATEVDIVDAPLEISEVTDTVSFALNTIAAKTNAPADLFAYKEPRPDDRRQTHHVNTGPRAGRRLKLLPKAFGDQDVQLVGDLGPADINLFGTGDFFSSMGRAGGLKARTAVDSALHWLAVHQEPGGYWDAAKHEGNKSANMAMTGLACLAFMGAGHNTRRGEYRRQVIKGIEYIMKQQETNGLLKGSASGIGVSYTHSICTIALCEAFGRSHDEAMKKAAQKAIDYCVWAQNPDGGWRYQPRTAPSDTSVTAWYIQALKTAKLAQLKFDRAVFSRALAYIDSVTDQSAAKHSNGAVAYVLSENSTGKVSNGKPAMTAAAMVVRQFNGLGVKHHLLVKGAKLTQAKGPDWQQKDFYYWYYATYAMHNMGGEYRLWWNRRIRDVLLQHQVRDGADAGSWDPEGNKHGEQGGRVYVTALGALCLEVYYRYAEALNAFGTVPDLDELFFQGGGGL